MTDIDIENAVIGWNASNYDVGAIYYPMSRTVRMNLLNRHESIEWYIDQDIDPMRLIYFLHTMRNQLIFSSQKQVFMTQKAENHGQMTLY